VGGRELGSCKRDTYGECRAERKNRKGRVKGGMIMGIRKEKRGSGRKGKESGGNKEGDSYGKGEDRKTEMENYWSLCEWKYGGNAEGDRREFIH